jgi:acetyl esterase
MIISALYPAIEQLLGTKFNDELKLPAELQKSRALWQEFIRIVSFSEAEYTAVQEIHFTPADLPAFKIRLYDHPLPTAELKPVLLYFHGGNWISGGLETCDAICRTLADGSGYVVISVDYALAPEHYFPTPLYQALAVIDWIREQGENYGIDSQKIVIGGDNAGGNIAAGLVHLLWQKHGIRIFGQILICPALHYRFDTASYETYKKGYFISRDFMKASWDMYLGSNEEKYSELVSPFLTSSVSHVPATLIFTAEHDPLRDEAELFASRLHRHGISVCFQRFEKTTQHFWLMDGILPVARQAQQQAIDFLLQINKIGESTYLETMSY